jgi:signal transduction histidine kinase
LLSADDGQGTFDTALNAGAWLWRAGCWLRATLLAGMWITLAWAPAGQLPRAAAQLGLATLALLLAFAHIWPGGVDLLARLRGLRGLAEHLGSTSGRATVDAAGLAEGAGALLATWVYVGFLPVPGLPRAVRAAGLALAVAYSWDAVLQAVIDPGWYSRAFPPRAGMRAFRYAIPPIFCLIITFVIWPWAAIDTAVPLAERILLALSPLAYYPVWVTFDVMLRASVTALRNSRTLWRWDAWGDAHSTVKNTLVFLQSYIEEPDPDLEEIRSLARNALVVIDEFRGALVGSPDAGPASGAPGGMVGDLWESVLRALGSPRRVRFTLEGDSALIRLSPTDYQVARRVLPDLMSNAIKAEATCVSARCTVAGDPAQVRVEVTDNGAGLPPGGAARPGGSLQRMGARLGDRAGGVEHAPAASGGTTAVAFWRADPGFR